MYVCVHVCMVMYVRSASERVACMYGHVCMCACMCAWSCMVMHVCVCIACVCACMYACVCVCSMCVCIVCVCACMYACVHVDLISISISFRSQSHFDLNLISISISFRSHPRKESKAWVRAERPRQHAARMMAWVDVPGK